jgi:mevalonate kinase
LISQDRFTRELYLFVQFIKQRKIIFACNPAPRSLLIDDFSLIKRVPIPALGYENILETSKQFMGTSKKNQGKTQTMVRENRNKTRREMKEVKQRIEGLKSRIAKAKEAKNKYELEEVLMEAHNYLLTNRKSLL